MAVATHPDTPAVNTVRKDLSFVSVHTDRIPFYFALKKTPGLFPVTGKRNFEKFPLPAAPEDRKEVNMFALSRLRSLSEPVKEIREPGYRVSSRARTGVRAAGQALFLDLKNNGSYSPYPVTLTFPDIPPDRLPGKSPIPYRERDVFCHELFKKFIRYEKTRHGLVSYVWVNERQSGDRGGQGRGMVHYHIVCLYGDTVDYRYVNLRWLRLLSLEGLSVFSEYASKNEAFRQSLTDSLHRADYKRLLKFYYVYDLKRKRHTIFRCPLDITPVVWNKNTYMRMFNCLLKYISKDVDDKIYCRRWGYSVDLRVNREAFDELVEQFNDYTVDTSTGEMQPVFNWPLYHRVFGAPPIKNGDGILMFSVNITDDLPPGILAIVYKYFNIPFDHPDRKKFHVSPAILPQNSKKASVCESF
jgi:hypothetical protein